jgi:hypothetical protein
MAANTTPIWSRAGDVQWGNVATANTALDGTGTASLIYTAPADGGRIEKFKVKHLGSNVATVLRLFINNGSAQSSAANNSLIAEMTSLLNTLSQTLASPESEIIGPWVLPAGYKIYATVGTTIAAGLQVTALGGKY